VQSSTFNLHATGGFSLGGDQPYDFGTLDLSSSTSARAIAQTVHSWSDKDLPGMEGGYCPPVMSGDLNGTTYAFAGSGCWLPGGVNPRYAPAAILAYNGGTQMTHTYTGIPMAKYKTDPDAATGPTFRTPHFDPRTGKFFVVSISNVANYEFTLSMLLEFDPQTGITSSLLELEVFHDITDSVFDPELGLLFFGIDDVYQRTKRTGIYDTRTRTIRYTPGALDAELFAGFDSTARKIVSIRDVGGSNPKTNYEYGVLDCNATGGCAFHSAGELKGLWCGVNPGYGAADQITSLAFDPNTRLLSVQSSGCYNITLGVFECYSNLGTEKFAQYRIPEFLNLQSSALTAEYSYAQATNYNDGLSMTWSGLSIVGMP